MSLSKLLVIRGEIEQGSWTAKITDTRKQRTYKSNTYQNIKIEDSDGVAWVELVNRPEVPESSKGKEITLSAPGLSMEDGKFGPKLKVTAKATMEISGEAIAGTKSSPSGGKSYGRPQATQFDQDTFEEHLRRALWLAQDMCHGAQIESDDVIQRLAATIVIAAKDHGVTLKINEDQAQL